MTPADCLHTNVDWEFDQKALTNAVMKQEWWLIWSILFNVGDCQEDEIALQMQCEDCGMLIKQRYRKVEE